MPILFLSNSLYKEWKRERERDEAQKSTTREEDFVPIIINWPRMQVTKPHREHTFLDLKLLQNIIKKMNKTGLRGVFPHKTTNSILSNFFLLYFFFFFFFYCARVTRIINLDKKPLTNELLVSKVPFVNKYILIIFFFCKVFIILRFSLEKIFFCTFSFWKLNEDARKSM